MIGGLETPTAGVLTIDGKDISTYSEAEMVRYRRDKAHRIKLTDEMLEAAGIESNKVRVDVQDGKLVISRI